MRQKTRGRNTRLATALGTALGACLVFLGCTDHNRSVSGENRPLFETSCANARDDDGDGLVDCADPDCRFNPACPTTETSCANGLDDDADGLVDCGDPDCFGVGPCPGGEADYTVSLEAAVPVNRTAMRLEFDPDELEFIASGPIGILSIDDDGDTFADFNCAPTTRDDLVDFDGDGRDDSVLVSCVHREPGGEVMGPGDLYRLEFGWFATRPSGSCGPGSAFHPAEVAIMDATGTVVADDVGCASVILP